MNNRSKMRMEDLDYDQKGILQQIRDKMQHIWYTLPWVVNPYLKELAETTRRAGLGDTSDTIVQKAAVIRSQMKNVFHGILINTIETSTQDDGFQNAIIKFTYTLNKIPDRELVMMASGDLIQEGEIHEKIGS